MSNWLLVWLIITGLLALWWVLKGQASYNRRFSS